MDVGEFMSLGSDERYNPVIRTNLADEEMQRIIGSGNTISEQLHGLEQLYRSISDYDGIDFSESRMILEYWTTEKLMTLPFPKWSGYNYEQEIKNATATTFLDWDCNLDKPLYGRRMGYWKLQGTWYVPIIIIKSSDFGSCSLQQPYQLFEGHTRLLRLKILNLHKNIELKDYHLVWVITKQNVS